MADMFKPRKARKVTLSDNPKTLRNREAEAAKRGYEAGLLKAKNTFRVNKHRCLKKHHDSPDLSSVGDQERQRREKDAIKILTISHENKLRELEREWDRKVDQEDIVDEEIHGLPLSDASSEEERDDDPVTENEGDAEEWEDDKEKDQISAADLLDIF